MVLMPIYREFHYDSAHYLIGVPSEHKCARLHGHTYRLIVEVTGPVQDNGFVMDFGDIDGIVKPFVEILDHTLINDEIPNPTVELQLIWFWVQLKPFLPELTELTIYEGLKNYSKYRGPGAVLLTADRV